MAINKLILGDNLEILKSMESDSIDLIYLDPPFFSNRNYEVIWGDKGEVRSFEDRWSGGISHYIDWLKERVEQMYRILKPTGSIFLHCDWHANAYIRVQILDRIFGENNFRNEIIWKRSSAHNDTKQGRKGLGHNADTIWFYSKTGDFIFNTLYTEYSKEYADEFYKHTDDNGRRYRLDNLTAAKGGGDTSYEFHGTKPYKGRYWAYSKENMEKFHKDGLLYFPKNNGTPSFKRYLDTMPGVPLQEVWDDIKVLPAISKERIGYPTQKPEALLERIVNMASNEGDTVLDPFVGGGTTIAVADKLNRKWLGIDQSPMAVKVTEFRLQKQTNLFQSFYTVQLHKYDYDTLRHKEAFEFETWIIQQFGGVPQNKKGGDKGIDGKASDGTPIQVKRSDNVPRDVIDKFPTAVQRYDKSLFEKNKKAKNPAGYIIAFSFGRGAVEEVSRLKNEENIIIKLIKVEEIVPIAVKPTLKVEINETAPTTPAPPKEGNVRHIEFKASGQSEAGIEFYSWDFAYDKEKGFKPSVIIDKEGKQTLTLKAGMHTIAVKVVDNDGLENTEIIKLKINGMVEQV
jgi:DNA modification methylase